MVFSRVRIRVLLDFARLEESVAAESRVVVYAHIRNQHGNPCPVPLVDCADDVSQYDIVLLTHHFLRRQRYLRGSRLLPV